MRTIDPPKLMDAATEKRRRARLGNGTVMTSGGGFARHLPPGKIFQILGVRTRSALASVGCGPPDLRLIFAVVKFRLKVTP